MILGVPVINRPDLLARLLASIDEPWPVMVIDNSDGGDIAEVCGSSAVTYVPMPSNLGVAASWNFIIRTHPAESWWCIANADTEFRPGDLAALAAEMAKPGPRWVGMNGDWRVFGINAEAVERVGFFDESFVPCYCEDADYEYRCTLAGVPWYTIPGGATHAGSAAIKSEARYAAGNARSYPANVDYYRRKWGGSLRGGERFTTPFDAGGSVREWTLDLSRLRELAW